MLTQELLLLGILKEGSKHGYELKKRIKEITDNLTLPAISSIYYPLRILEKKKFVIRKKGQEGKRPKKYTYSLTKKGEERFLELLEQSLLVIKRPNFDLNISLYFLPHVDSKIALRRLRARKNFLNRIRGGVTQIKAVQGAGRESRITSILDHNLTLVQAEIDFISKIINHLEKES